MTFSFTEISVNYFENKKSTDSSSIWFYFSTCNSPRESRRAKCKQSGSLINNVNNQ